MHMLKTLHILSHVTKFIFYGLMLYFLVLVAGILSGAYRFAETNTVLYYMIATSSVAMVSLLLSDLHGFMKNRKSRKGLEAEDPGSGDE